MLFKDAKYELRKRKSRSKYIIQCKQGRPTCTHMFTVVW